MGRVGGSKHTREREKETADVVCLAWSWKGRKVKRRSWRHPQRGRLMFVLWGGLSCWLERAGGHWEGKVAPFKQVISALTRYGAVQEGVSCCNRIKYSVKLRILTSEGVTLTTQSCDLLLHNDFMAVLHAARGLYMWELARCCAAAPGQIRETPSSAPMTDEWVSLCRTPQTVCSGYPSGHSAAPLFDINSLTSCHYAAPADMTSVQLVWVWLWQAWDFYGTQMISWLWNDEHSAAKYSLSALPCLPLLSASLLEFQPGFQVHP